MADSAVAPAGDGQANGSTEITPGGAPAPEPLAEQPASERSSGRNSGGKGISEVMKDRRQYQGGNDGEDDARDPPEITVEELRKRARVHMVKTACTKWDEAAHEYKFLPVWGTPERELWTLGIGVQLYFQFLRQMAIVFLILTVLTMPLLVTSSLGDRVSSEGLQDAFGRLSIANLGVCGTGGCTEQQLKTRRVSSDSDAPGVHEMTPYFGTLDGAALLIFMSFGLWFSKFWIPREVLSHNDAHVTPADFAVRVTNLPRRLEGEEEHKEYENQLKEHFTKVLRERCGVTDEDPLVQEVSLVREHHGAIEAHITQGQNLLYMHELEVEISLETDEKRKSKLQKKLDSAISTTALLDQSLGDDAGKNNEDRDVCSKAFVILSKDMYAQQLLREYRLAQSMIFRCCEEEDLRFKGKCIAVRQAGEPTDLFWENMDRGRWWRRARLCATCVMSLIILAVCLVALVYCKMNRVPTLAPVPSGDLWVLKSVNDECLQLCDWRVYSDHKCQSGGGLGTLTAVWDLNGSLTGSAHPSLSQCSNGSWASPRCTGQSGAGAQWIGVQFSGHATVACMEFQQATSAASDKVELYVCSSSSLVNRSSGAALDWNPMVHCIGLQDLTPAVDTQGSWSRSGRQRVLSDSTCRRMVSHEAAVEALEERIQELRASDSTITESDAKYTASSSDPTMNCYCKQQEIALGLAAFRAPPYSGPIKNLCYDWIFYQNMKLTMMAVGVLAVCLLNQLLVLVFTYFVVLERHDSWTRQSTSQFFKLFLAQFLNMAMIVLIVNANWRGTLSEVGIIDALGLGKGAYDDIDAEWYTAVGSGVCLTMLTQVVSATTPAIIMSHIVNPLLIRFWSMGLVTQKMLNQVHVFPEWDLARNLAQTTANIFVLITYSGGMPVMNAIGFLYCLMAYWMDKWCLLRGSMKPPAYDASLMKLTVSIFPGAALLHTVLTLWSFGNQYVFPSDWSVLQSFYGGLINMDLTRYQNIMEEYYSASEQKRNDMFSHYLHARSLDMARWSCWLLLCIFLVFCVYYIVNIVLILVLRPFGFLRKCCGQTLTEKTPIAFSEASTEMMHKGLCVSYLPQNNPRYSLLQESMHEGKDKIKKAREMHETRLSEKKGSKAKSELTSCDEQDVAQTAV